MTLGETIDSFCLATPRPAIDRDQTGLFAVSVRNLPDPSLGLVPGWSATQLVVRFFPPDATGQPDRTRAVVMGDGVPFALDPGHGKAVFQTFTVAHLAAGVVLVTLAYEVTGVNADGRPIVRGQSVQLDVRR